MRQVAVEPNLPQVLTEVADQVAVCGAERSRDWFHFYRRAPARIEDLPFEPPLLIADTEAIHQQNRSGRPLQVILSRLDF